MLNIDEMISSAMKEKDSAKLKIYRLIKSEFLKKAAEPGRKQKELSEDEQIKIMTKMADQRKESAEIYTKAGRTELAEAELSELAYLKDFLPEEVSEEAIETCVNEIIDDLVNANRSWSMRDMGTIIGKVKQKYPYADSKVISKIVSKHS